MTSHHFTNSREFAARGMKTKRCRQVRGGSEWTRIMSNEMSNEILSNYCRLPTPRPIRAFCSAGRAACRVAIGSHVDMELKPEAWKSNDHWSELGKMC